MSNGRKRKQDNLSSAQTHANNGINASLFGNTNGEASLTASLFGDSSAETPQNHLFSSPTTFQDAVKEHTSKNENKQTKRQATINDSNTASTKDATINTETRESILLKRKKQSLLPFLTEITSLAPFPVDQDDDEILLDKKKHAAAASDNENDETTKVPPDVCIQEIADIVRIHGFAVVKNVISKTHLNTLSARAQEIEAHVCQGLDNRGIAWKCDSTKETQTFRFYEVASRCKGRMDVRYGTDQEPFCRSEVIDNASLQPIIDSLLLGGGTNDASHAPILLYVGLIFSFVGSEHQPWHQDGMPLFPEWSIAPDDLPPYAINVFFPLTDNDASIEAGPTEFIPGSHIMEEDVVLSKVEQAKLAANNEVGPGIVSPVLQQGDALLYDYRVCHRGTSNLLLNGKTRRILYLMYARPWFKEHLNFGSERLFQE